MYAKKASEQIDGASWDDNAPDSSLGEFFAQQKQELEHAMSEADVSDKFSTLVQDSFRAIMERYMDTLDRQIQKNQAIVQRLPHMAGSLRTESIDREAVYHAFQSAMASQTL